MTNAELRRIAQKEHARRAKRKAASKTAFDLDGAFHAKQAALVRAIVERKKRFIEANCGRQSGKSHGCAGATNLVASSTPGANTLYVTKTYASCEKMAFKPACKLNTEWGLAGRDRSGKTLDITFPSGTTSYYMGADTEGTIEKLRGTPNLALVVIDEAGLYDPDDLRLMIEAVTPGLRPLAGTLVVAGTPSRAGEQGTWYDITKNPSFDHHYFDYRDNDRVPSFAEVERLIDEELAMMFPNLSPGERRETAYFKREYLAQFVVDLAEKVYQLSNANLVDDIPGDLPNHASGGDIGVAASDALVSLGWQDDGESIYVDDQEEASSQDTLAYAAMVKAHHERHDPFRIWVDPGGLGDKAIKTVKAMFPDIPIEAAEKPPIGVQVHATNALLQSGRLKIKRGSKLALELSAPTWVDGVVGGKIDEHGKHSDLVPSLRYVCVAVPPFLPELEPPKTEDEKKRDKYLASVKRGEKQAKQAALRDKGYDADEFGESLTDDLEQ